MEVGFGVEVGFLFDPNFGLAEGLALEVAVGVVVVTGASFALPLTVDIATNGADEVAPPLTALIVAVAFSPPFSPPTVTSPVTEIFT